MADMKFIEYPALPRRLPAAVLGTMHFNPSTQGGDFALLDAYVAAGGDALDTAHVYGAGASERVIGHWLKAQGNRKSVTLVTKGCHPKGDGNPRVTPEAIREDISESLDRLLTGYADIWLFHRDDPAVPVGELVDALNTGIRNGMIHAAGASNWTIARIREANDYAAKRGLAGFCLSSVNLSLAVPQVQVWPGCLSAGKEDLEWHEKAGFPLLAWSPQARGLFNERYERGTPWSDELKRLFGYPGSFARLERARVMAREKSATSNRIALAWVLSRPFPVSAVIGPRNKEQMADSLEAMDLRLSPREMEWLEQG